MGFGLNSQKSSNSPLTILVGLYPKLLMFFFFFLGWAQYSSVFTSQNTFMAFYISHYRLMATLFHHLKDWAHGSYILHIVIQTYGLCFILWNGVKPASCYVITNWQYYCQSHLMGSRSTFLTPHGLGWKPICFFSSRDQESRLKAHICFFCLFMEGFPIKLVHLVLFRYKTGLIT